MALPNPYQQYRQQQVNTAPPEKLLLMLFDGAVRFGRIAVKSLQEKQDETAHAHLLKTQAIVEELISSLNFDYEIAQYLYSLYDYIYRRLVEANIKKDPAMAEEAVNMLTELRGAFAGTMAKPREGTV